MSRRSQGGVQDFGSDSFLDIIANIVGILIILIVIAGMKVAHQSAEPEEAHTITEIDSETASIELPPLPVNEEFDASEVASPEFSSSVSPSVTEEFHDAFGSPQPAPSSPVDEQEELNNSETLTDLAEMQQKINAERAALVKELDQIELERQAIESEISEVTLQRTDLEKELDSRQVTADFATERREAVLKEQERLARVKEEIESDREQNAQDRDQVETTLDGLTKRQKYVNDALEQIAQETRQLREVLLENPPVAEPTDRINHRISPVSRTVQTEEQHFRLENGRVAHIPLEGLLERLRKQVAQKTSIVRRFRRAEGIVGPVGGFRMTYVVERQSADPIQALKYGQSGYRVTVSRWTVVPAETLAAETVTNALRLGSRFRQVIESASPDTVLTIWLYPEDFAHFAKLRELAHRLNLRVAARPLPKGTPIAGSPNGSQSASQ